MSSNNIILCHHFSFCLQSFPASGSFPISQLFTSGGQSIGASASASILPVNIQGWFPLGLTGWISLQAKGGEGTGDHTSSFTGKSHGQRSLVGCSPLCPKELDMTEQLNWNPLSWPLSSSTYMGIFSINSFLLLFIHLVVSYSLWPHGPQHTRLPWPLLSPRVCSNSCPLNTYIY